MSKRAEGNWGCLTAIALLMCGCALPLGLVDLIWGNAYKNCFGSYSPSYADIEKEAFFKLPASAHHIEYDAVDGSESCTIWTKFELAPEDLEGFQVSTLIKSFGTIQLAGDSFSYFMEQKGWVQPANPIAGFSQDYPYTRQWIFIDTTNPGSFIVYIIVYKAGL